MVDMKKHVRDDISICSVCDSGACQGDPADCQTRPDSNYESKYDLQKQMQALKAKSNSLWLEFCNIGTPRKIGALISRVDQLENQASQIVVNLASVSFDENQGATDFEWRNIARLEEIRGSHSIVWVNIIREAYRTDTPAARKVMTEIGKCDAEILELREKMLKRSGEETNGQEKDHERMD